MDYEIVKRQIDKIQNEGRDLTDWEKSFIKSIVTQFKNGRVLSSRQLEIVDRIYTDKTPTGTTFGEGEYTGRVASEKTERFRNEGRDEEIPGGLSSWRQGLRDKYGNDSDI
jgi:hypothetical protein